MSKDDPTHSELKKMTRGDAERWLRERNPALFARFDRAFALLSIYGLTWCACPSPFCDGCALAIDLPGGKLLIHIHPDDFPTDRELADEIMTDLVTAATIDDQVRAAGAEPHTMH